MYKLILSIFLKLLKVNSCFLINLNAYIGVG